jgi:hypothetical protein
VVHPRLDLLFYRPHGDPMRFPDHSDLGVVNVEGVGEFRLSMDRIVLDARGDETTEIVIRPIVSLDVALLAEQITDHYASGRHGMSNHACATAIAIGYAAAMGGPVSPDWNKDGSAIVGETGAER